MKCEKQNVKRIQSRSHSILLHNQYSWNFRVQEASKQPHPHNLLQKKEKEQVNSLSVELFKLIFIKLINNGNGSEIFSIYTPGLMPSNLSHHPHRTFWVCCASGFAIGHNLKFNTLPILWIKCLKNNPPGKCLIILTLYRSHVKQIHWYH